MDDWKKELKSRFDDYQTGEPDGLWDSIEKELPTKKRPVIPFGWITLAAVAAAAALAVFVVPVDRKVSKQSEPIAVVEVAPASSDKETILPDIPSISEEPDIVKAIADVIPVKTIQVADYEESEPSTAEPDLTEGLADLITEKSSTEKQAPQESYTTSGQEIRDMELVPREVPSKKKQSLSYKISTSASISSSSISSGYGSSVLNTRSDISDGSISMMKTLLTTNQLTEKTIDHRMPIRVSFDLIYNITENIGIGTGLSRTALYSRIHSGTPTVFTDSEQKMVLVGIPLSLFYEIPISGGRFGLYASIGGMWEKAVDYSLESNEYIGGKKDSTHNYSGGVPNYSQWSVNAVVGGQMRLSRNSGWAVFAEAGASRHFDNGSEISTIYNDKPLMPLVNFGLRYSINN